MDDHAQNSASASHHEEQPQPAQKYEITVDVDLLSEKLYKGIMTSWSSLPGSALTLSLKDALKDAAFQKELLHMCKSVGTTLVASMFTPVPLLGRKLPVPQQRERVVQPPEARVQPQGRPVTQVAHATHLTRATQLTHATHAQEEEEDGDDDDDAKIVDDVMLD